MGRGHVDRDGVDGGMWMGGVNWGRGVDRGSVDRRDGQRVRTVGVHTQSQRQSLKQVVCMLVLSNIIYGFNYLLGLLVATVL